MSLKAAKVQLKTRYLMLTDYAGTIVVRPGTIAATVARRHFREAYKTYVSAYESLVASDSELAEEERLLYQQQFSEVNRLLIQLDEASEEEESGRPSTSKHQGKVKLPLVQLPTFSGCLAEWLSFYDLFMSLVDAGPLSDAEKHYYLRTSLNSEALSIVQHLPMDGDNYTVALDLLKQRYHNSRQLVDTFIGQILNLPNVGGPSVNLRTQFYDPLREAIQALRKLKQPVDEWSYLLLHLILQKLPLRVKTLFEERHGTDPQVLPTLTQLVSLLDEQCRVQQAISPAAVERTPAARRSPTARGRGGAAPAHHLAAPRVLAAQPEPNDQACRLRNQQLQRLCTECKISHRLTQPRGGDHHRSGGHHLDRPRHRREGRSRPTHHNHAHHYRGVWRKLGLPPYQTRHLFWWLLVTFHACRLERGPARRRRPSTPCALALDAALSPGNEMISLLVNQRHGG
ncbi:uncharacterized protein LOC125235833 isoform X4 [Leguminivora glycinivorella]|uniref:uncharacterized protein LOC125235833 isoform X4 n=1 Tax=Leguminivora glycinivorella TaxID=1035111 RepID=UPI00200DA37C|nr:uncharacterized protein LOC125235833 isoform X4 [Leguminivora glycinivorella]XP_047998394.1 uncharacterized protein LOC125235833 isoform X4 [Leguminivora glycinivorella]